jgi:hypothetical protein
MKYELKARTLSEILDGTFKLYRDNASAFLTISAIASVPLVGFQMFAAWAKPMLNAGSVGTSLALVAGLLILLPVVLIAIYVQYCALSIAAADAYQGRPFTPQDAFSRTFNDVGGLLWASLIFSFGIGLGYVCCIVPGIYLTLIWAVWLQAFAVEGKRGSEALTRSKVLTKGNLGQIGLILLVFLAVQLALMYGISAAIPAALAGIPVLGAALQQAASILISPLYPSLLTLIYFDGRIRHEGYDLEVAAASAPAPAAVP